MRSTGELEKLRAESIERYSKSRQQSRQRRQAAKTNKKEAKKERNEKKKEKKVKVKKEEDDSDEDKPLRKRQVSSDSDDSDPDLTSTELGVVDKIVATHLWARKNRRYYLVHWKGHDPQTKAAWEPSWEPASGLVSCASALAAYKKANPGWKDERSEECEKILEDELEEES